MFGFSILYCTAFNDDDKSYGQVLTLINNSQLLLKLEIYRQAQTCYKPTVQTTKETATFSSLY